LQIAQISELVMSQQLWQPEHYLPPRTNTSHPLLESVTSQLIDDIKKYCQQTPQTVIAFSTYRPTMAVQTYSLRNLISHRKLINGKVINLFLETSAPNTTWHSLALPFLIYFKEMEDNEVFDILHPRPVIDTERSTAQLSKEKKPSLFHVLLMTVTGSL
jgi:hypothetical protein